METGTIINKDSDDFIKLDLEKLCPTLIYFLGHIQSGEKN